MESPVLLKGNRYLPRVGMRGEFTLKSPFNAIIIDKICTVLSIRTISSLAFDSIDVFKEHYEAFGLSREEYEKDVELDKEIITIQSDGGVSLSFPAGYIDILPKITGIPYVVYHAVIELPPFPEEVNWAAFSSGLKDYCQKALGVPEVRVNMVQMSEKTLVSKEDHELTQADRNLKKEKSALLEVEKWKRLYQEVLADREELYKLLEG